jgi:hypothetical protein
MAPTPYLSCDETGWHCPHGRFLFGLSWVGGVHLTDNGRVGYDALCGVVLDARTISPDTTRRDLCPGCLDALPVGE